MTSHLATSDNSLNRRLDYFSNLKFWVEFNGRCINRDKVTFPPDKIMNLYTFEVKSWSFSADSVLL